jgi:hypothetical protein
MKNKGFLAIVLAIGLLFTVTAGAASDPVPAAASNTLASPESFSSIAGPVVQPLPRSGSSRR